MTIGGACSPYERVLRSKKLFSRVSYGNIFEKMFSCSTGVIPKVKIRALAKEDRERLCSVIVETRVFTHEEVQVAVELIDLVLEDPSQKDYEIQCMVSEEEQAIGYVCYGPVPMTQGTFDLYWIAVDPRYHGKGVGSRLLRFIEEVIRGRDGRMILVDTSSIPQYEKAQQFYARHGFEEVARVPDYYHPGNDRITFCKRLTGE